LTYPHFIAQILEGVDRAILGLNMVRKAKHMASPCVARAPPAL